MKPAPHIRLRAAFLALSLAACGGAPEPPARPVPDRILESQRRAPLTPDEVAPLARFVQRLLRGRDAATEGFPAALRERRATVRLSLRAAGREVIAGWQIGPSILAAVGEGLRAAREAVDVAPVDTVVLDLAHSFVSFVPAIEPAVLANENRGRIGLELFTAAGTFRVSPTESITTNRRLTASLGGLLERAGIAFDTLPESGAILRWFAADQVLIELGRPPVARRLVRGNLPVAPEDVDAKALAALDEALSGWMRRNVPRKGGVLWRWDPATRRAGSVGAHEAWRVILDVKELSAADPSFGEALDALLAAAPPPPDAAADTGSAPDTEVLALREMVLGGEGRAVPPALRAQTPPVPVVLRREAMNLPDPVSLAALQKGIIGVPRPSATVALADRILAGAEARRRSGYGTFAAVLRDDCDALLELQDLRDDPADFAGRFYEGTARRNPSSDATAIALRALVPCLGEAEARAHGERSRRIRQAIRFGARSLLQVAFLDDDLFWVTSPDRTRGGVRRRVYDATIRLRQVSASLLAVREIRELFADEREAGAARDGAAGALRHARGRD